MRTELPCYKLSKVIFYGLLSVCCPVHLVGTRPVPTLPDFIRLVDTKSMFTLLELTISMVELI